jgi:uncharacterized protein (DUF983 family)
MQNNRLLAILLCRCPVCLQGRVFKSLLRIYPDCPHCGIHYERETGYFLNAMFFAYCIGFVILVPTMLYLYFQQVSTFWFTTVVTIELVVLWPWVFRYSRVLWLHIDQLLDRRPPAGQNAFADTTLLAESSTNQPPTTPA